VKAADSFAALLEILDPQRFMRGFPVEPDDLEPVMVRRLKNDLRTLGVARLPRRIIEPAVIDGLSADAPDPLLRTRAAPEAAAGERANTLAPPGRHPVFPPRRRP
jgi:hypothetical protein